MQVVIDTNVIVSALLQQSSLPAKVLNIVLNNKATIVYDNRIFAEYVDVLYRDKFRIKRELVSGVLGFIKKKGDFLFAESQKIKFSDETDKKFYEVFKSSKAHYLITGNIKHFPNDAGIVTPKEFLEKEII